MEKVLFKSKHNKPIYEGQQHYVVMDKGEIVRTIAVEGQTDIRIKERFLSNSGAVKFAKQLLAEAKQIIKETITEQKKADNEENKISKLKSFEQLDYVKNQEDFNSWLKRNNTKISTYDDNKIIIDNIIELFWSISSVPYCCGGREHGSHHGSILKDSQYLNNERMTILAKYLVSTFEKLIKSSCYKFGVISYILQPGNIGSPSGRIGFLFEASSLFTKVVTFKNPNTYNTLDLYTINDNWVNNT